MRVKRGTTKNKKHNKTLKAVKGYRGTYSKLYKRAREALLHAGQYNFAHRRARRGQKRQEWIIIISAGLYNTGTSYNQFISGLTKNGIELDRKVLAEMAQQAPADFAQLVKKVS